MLDLMMRLIGHDQHVRSVTEIWGRDEIKNADLFGGAKLQIGSCILKKPKNRHIMAKR